MSYMVSVYGVVVEGRKDALAILRAVQEAGGLAMQPTIEVWDMGKEPPADVTNDILEALH